MNVSVPASDATVMLASGKVIVRSAVGVPSIVNAKAVPLRNWKRPSTRTLATCEDVLLRTSSVRVAAPVRSIDRAPALVRLVPR